MNNCSKMVLWCSWLSRQSNTLKVSGSNPGEAIFSFFVLFCSLFLQLLCMEVIFSVERNVSWIFFQVLFWSVIAFLLCWSNNWLQCPGGHFNHWIPRQLVKQQLISANAWRKNRMIPHQAYQSLDWSIFSKLDFVSLLLLNSTLTISLATSPFPSSNLFMRVVVWHHFKFWKKYIHENKYYYRSKLI